MYALLNVYKNMHCALVPLSKTENIPHVLLIKKRNHNLLNSPHLPAVKLLYLMENMENAVYNFFFSDSKRVRKTQGTEHSNICLHFRNNPLHLSVLGSISKGNLYKTNNLTSLPMSMYSVNIPHKMDCLQNTVPVLVCVKCRHKST